MDDDDIKNNIGNYFILLYHKLTNEYMIKIPNETSKKRQQLLASKFILLSLNEKKSFFFIHNKLSNEFISIKTLNGSSIKICDTFQKNVETNKIFMQYHF